jgi:hypothetical protein
MVLLLQSYSFSLLLVSATTATRYRDAKNDRFELYMEIRNIDADVELCFL